MRYAVAEAEFDDDDDENTWDADDWRFTVIDGTDEIVAICASKKEADHIARLLNDDPIPE